MIKQIINSSISTYLQWRYSRLQRSLDNIGYTQETLLKKLLQTAQQTSFGRDYNFRKIKNYNQYASTLPIFEYDDLKPYIKEMMHGGKNILWNGRVNWFSKSAGTTSDKSKFIPVTRENLFGNHIKGTWDTISVMYHHHPKLKLFASKSLVMGGSIDTYSSYPSTKYGDISAIMIHHMPGIGRPFYVPSFEVALMSDWEEKIEQTAKELINEKDMVMFGGVPTWNLVLFKRILEKTGADNLLDIWPNLSAYIHGGVSFEPYKAQFKKLIPSDSFTYMEVYNASEGYFGVSHLPGSKDLLLLPDNGTFYEFIPMKNYITGNLNAVPIEGVKTGENYAMVVSTNSGLWRYIIGDTVEFTSTSPHLIRITGRTQQFVNAFGEEVMVANTDEALSKACRQHSAIVQEYTVAPIYFDIDNKGGHQWIVEFEKPPKSLTQFSIDLDRFLQEANSDYEAKRSLDLALNPLHIIDVPPGTFVKWMKSKGKMGGQNKVPRLSNHRKVVDEIIDFVQQTG